MGGGFSELSESVIGFECHLYIRVFEQVGNFSNVRCGVREGSPFCALFSSLVLLGVRVVGVFFLSVFTLLCLHTVILA